MSKSISESGIEYDAHLWGLAVVLTYLVVFMATWLLLAYAALGPMAAALVGMVSVILCYRFYVVWPATRFYHLLIRAQHVPLVPRVLSRWETSLRVLFVVGFAGLVIGLHILVILFVLARESS